MNRKSIIRLVILIIIMQGCSIEKRHYMSGYHMEWNKKSKATEKPQYSADHLIENANLEIAEQHENVEEGVQADRSERIVVEKKNNLSSRLHKKGILLNSKFSVRGKNVLIDVLLRNKIAPTAPLGATPNNDVPVNNNQAMAAGVMGILCWVALIFRYVLFFSGAGTSIIVLFGLAAFLFAILAVVFGHVGRAQIKREPNKYIGHGMANLGLVLGYVYLGLLTLVIILIVVFFARFIS